MRINNELNNSNSNGGSADPCENIDIAAHFASLGEPNPVSRAQAKRLLQHVVQAGESRLVLDFGGVVPAFADEVFRVFANAHPRVELVTIHAVSEVQQMIRRAEVARDRDNGQLPLL